MSPGSPDGPSGLLAGREAREACARRARVRGVRKGPVRRHAPRAGSQGSRPESAPRRRYPEARRRATSDVAAGDREISGCARGLFWLQKSTSGAGSTPSGMGLAPTPHAREGNLPARFCLGRGAFASRKGVKKRRGLLAHVTGNGDVAGPVESRRVHAAASPRVRAAAMPCGRVGIPVMRGPGDARATAPVNLGDAEGAVVDGRRPGPARSAALDEAAGEAGLPARWRGFCPFSRGGRGSDGGSDRGRQRPRHEPGQRPRTPRPGGIARRSCRSELRQDRVVPSSTRALGV